MASNVSVTYNFVAGTDAVADHVDTNFNDIVAWVNTNAVHLDGTKAFTGIPSGPASNPTTANQLARKAYVDSVAGLPIGGITLWSTNTAPTGYLLCDGSAVNRGDYVDLFTLIGTTYGAGNGTTTFNLPNLKGRVPVGRDSAQTEFDVLAETGGAKTHTLTTAEMPSHTHTQDAHTHVQNAHTHTQDAHTHTQNAHNHPPAAGYDVFTVQTNTAGFSVATASNIQTAANVATTGNATATNQNTTATNQNTTATNQNATATNQNTGGGAAHNNLQPYIVLNYIIRAI